ncbi:hypothetical protein [Janibacter sp. UYMM211]|uniref:hypothetical protein n=1 Tax=Janibacter sp. UYMM211 TaxID=3156342 RepID=UPI0033989385
MAEQAREGTPATKARVQTKSGRVISARTQRAAARVYVKASEKAGEPVSQRIRDLASGRP